MITDTLVNDQRRRIVDARDTLLQVGEEGRYLPNVRRDRHRGTHAVE